MDAAVQTGLVPRLKGLKAVAFPGSSARLPVWRSVLLSPLVFAAWYWSRHLWFRATGHKLRRLDPASGISSFVANEVMDHNMGNMRLINRARTERLIQVLRAVGGFQLDAARLLVVGPRNEAELLLFRAYGARSRNLRAIDLFTECPAIELMDMHRLEIADSSMDALYSSFVITYSDDIPRAVAETIRVCRSGAIVAFGFQHMREGAGNKFGLNCLAGGTAELLGLFADAVGHVLWAEDLVRSDGSTHCSVVFRLVK